MLSRRGLLTMAGGLTLAGCGFQPVYMPTASGGAGVAQRDLASVDVGIIPERPGMLLRQALQARLDGSGSVVPRRYNLAVFFTITGEGLAIQPDNTATRVRMTGNASWILQGIDRQSRITSGVASFIDGFNILDQQYFAADMSGEAAQKRIADNIADQIVLQLAGYFRHQASAAVATR